MRRTVPLLALACVAACAALVGWKVLALGYTLDPRPTEEGFSVEFAVHAQGRGERARLHLALPSGTRTVLDDERFSNPGLKLAIRARANGRVATFSSEPASPAGALSAIYRFSVRVPRDGGPPAPGPAPRPDDSAASAVVPASDEEVRAKAVELNPTAPDDVARVRGLYDFVLDEIAAGPEPEGEIPPEAALEALRTRRAGAVARNRLFVALVRSIGVPARLVWTVPLVEGAGRRLHARAEAFLEGAWTTIDPVRGRFGRDAEGGFVVLRGDGPFVRGEGVDDLRLAVTITREGRNEWALHQRRAGHGEGLLDRLSLDGLPPRTQLAFRVLLLVPLGALIVAIFRNVVGVPTFGTFMPILIALALRETGPLPGLVTLAVIVLVGFVGRRALERMRLLIVPRLALLLTLVIFLMGAVALAASRFGAGEGYSVALLPIVILTMTIERLSVLIAEEGVRNALKTTLGTVVVAAAGYVAIQSDGLQRLVFTFPELNLLVVAALLLLGRYTGYRLSELLRFQALARPSPAPGSPDPAVSGSDAR